MKMIYDRTETDIIKSRELLDKIKNGEEITISEREILERGCITINTLNRISTKQKDLKDRFDSFSYFCGNIVVRNWDYNDIFRLSNFQEIIENLSVLRTAFFAFRKTPANPIPKYHFSNINDLEKILFDLESNLDYMIASFPECGNYECGEW